MKLIEIELDEAAQEPTTLKYKVEIKLRNNWILAHTGKFFVDAGQDTVKLDLDDLLINWQFQGKQSIKPTANATYDAYMPTVADTYFLEECWYNEVKVSSLNSAFTAVTKSFFFLPTQIFGYQGITLDGDGYLPASHHFLLPTLPANKPDNFIFSTLYYAIAASKTVSVKRNDTTIGTIVTVADTPYHIKLNYTAGTECVFTVGGVPVAKTENACNSAYYLVWVQNDGALNCQPFTKASKFSIEFTNKTAVDIRNAEWRISSTAEGKWVMKSKTVSEQEFKDFASLFNSPYILLLDIETGRMHYVNVSKSTYEEKRRSVKDKKPLYFEIEVKSADKIRV